MKPNIKAILRYSLVVLVLLGSIFGAALLSRYASRVSTSIFMSFLNTSISSNSSKSHPVQIRTRNVLERFREKNQDYHLVKLEYPGTTAFFYMVTGSDGRLAKTVMVKKIGNSAFAPYVGDSAFHSKKESLPYNQNPLVNAIDIKLKSLQSQIETRNVTEGGVKK